MKQRKKNHEQFHTARPTEYEQATKNAFRSATLVYNSPGAAAPGNVFVASSM